MDRMATVAYPRKVAGPPQQPGKADDRGQEKREAIILSRFSITNEKVVGEVCVNCGNQRKPSLNEVVTIRGSRGRSC